MKELSIEEKARRYDGLIERLKDLQFAYRFSSLSDTIEEKFPEIKESGDERIRKALIKWFESYGGQNLEWYDGLTPEKAVAWLEKQGEQKPNPNSQWKPSDEQIEALGTIINHVVTKTSYFDALEDLNYRNLEKLYNDLKKLREE